MQRFESKREEEVRTENPPFPGQGKATKYFMNYAISLKGHNYAP